jgi:hypothetical protein
MKKFLLLLGIQGEFPGVVKLLSLIPFSPVKKIPQLLRRIESYGSQAMQAFDTSEIEFENGFKRPTMFSAIINEERKLHSEGKMDSRYRLERADIETEAASMILAGSCPPPPFSLPFL